MLHYFHRLFGMSENETLRDRRLKEVINGIELSLYTDTKKEDNTWYRTFSNTDKELEWHRDSHDRLVEVIEGSDWMIQFDNDLPVNINKTNTIFIPKGVYHRLHRGNDKLVIRIKEYKND